MKTLTNTNDRTRFGLPRLAWGWLARRPAAYDQLYRERAALAVLDHHILRDIGVARGDLDAALSRPDEHLRLILLRGGNQFQR